MTHPRDEQPEWSDREGADRKADRIEGQGADRVHGFFLSDKPKSPDRRCKQQEEVGGDGRQAHPRKVACRPASGGSAADDRGCFPGIDRSQDGFLGGRGPERVIDGPPPGQRPDAEDSPRASLRTD